MFAAIVYRDDHFIKQLRRPGGDIVVPKGDRIKGPRVGRHPPPRRRHMLPLVSSRLIRSAPRPQRSRSVNRRDTAGAAAPAARCARGFPAAASSPAARPYPPPPPPIPTAFRAFPQ